MSTDIAVRVSPKGAAMPAFSGVPITRGRMGRRTEKAKKYSDKNFNLLMATVEQEDSQWL